METTNSARVHAVDYDALVSDPLGTRQQFHERFGWDWTLQSAEAARRWLDANPQHKHRKHRYELSDHGLSPQRLEALRRPRVATGSAG